MQTSATRRIDSLLALPRSAKKGLAVLVDSALCVLTAWLAICLRFEAWVNLSGYQWLAVVVSVGLAIPLLTAFGFYHTVIRYVGRQTITAALRAIGIYAIIYCAVFTAYGFPLVPRTIGILQPILLLVGLALCRMLASQLLSAQPMREYIKTISQDVLIYGAGSSGQQLAASLLAKGQTRIIGFIDANTGLQGARVLGIPVYGPHQLPGLVQREDIQAVLLAMPSIDRSQRNLIIQSLRQFRFPVRTIPSMTEIAAGRVDASDLKEIDIEDLLGRDPVSPLQDLLSKKITGKTVMVTGAGGSIGSELCRQILKLSPQKLIALDSNEYYLYRLAEEVQQLPSSPQAPVMFLLANVQEKNRITALIQEYRPDTIYHAAAYKHVPLVESNPLAALKNNVLGTKNVAEAALDAQVSDMVLISTDKAVRPTNIMGASKRMAEICLQDLAMKHKDDSASTTFCIVRFGNVLGSSGSVVPKFKEQIRLGGPITITHPEVTRYFMTIPEAAQLVLQAAALHSNHKDGAKLYLLDMGESVKIADLARSMIQLTGHTEKTDQNPSGDIEIQTIGLRPGEKLYEELLLEGQPAKTRHPKIFEAQEASTVDLSAFDQSQHILFSDKPMPREQIVRILHQMGIGYSPQ